MAAGTGEDPFRVLHDDVLDHILSFLPGDDALQTCVLNTQWRDLWRRKTSLRFIFDEWSSFSCERFSQLVKLIIHLRGKSPLTYCKINPCIDEDYDDFTQTKLLIKYVLKCRVEKLSVCDDHFGDERLLLDGRLFSRQLKTMRLCQVDLINSSVDFSRCPVLEELTLEDCRIDERIFSKSLKHLWFIGDCIFPQDFRIHIDAPRLISLHLDEFDGMTPSLGKMLLLETAYVMLGQLCNDSCESYPEDCDDPSCECRDEECLLLDGLSSAVDLELIADPGVNFVGATGSKQSFVCAPTLAVNIECGKVDKGVRKILKVLSTCGILREQINIKCCSCTQILPSTDWNEDVSLAMMFV